MDRLCYIIETSVSRLHSLNVCTCLNLTFQTHTAYVDIYNPHIDYVVHGDKNSFFVVTYVKTLNNEIEIMNTEKENMNIVEVIM